MIFHTSPMHSALHSGGFRRNIAIPFGREQELSYRKQLCTQYVEGIYDNPVTLKSRLTVTGNGTIE